MFLRREERPSMAARDLGARTGRCSG